MAAKRKSTGKAITKWEEELAREAEVAAAAEANAGGGQFFSAKGGILTFQDAPLPNNEMAVIVLDSIFENVYYEGDYDPDNPAPPTCFAFASDEHDLTPHQAVVDMGWAQSLDGCTKCENNEWGSADKGRGKACRNTRRLAMLPAGSIDDRGKLEVIDEDALATAAIGFMKLPVTSVKGYASYVKQVAGALRRPPFGIFTRVSVVPDPKTQFKVLFEPISSVPDDLMGTLMTRVEEARSTIDFPYQLEEEEEAPPPPRRGGAKKKAAAKKKTAKTRGKRKY